MNEKNPNSFFGRSFLISCIVVAVALIIAVGAMAAHSIQVKKKTAEDPVQAEPVPVIVQEQEEPSESAETQPEAEPEDQPEETPAPAKVERIAIRYYEEEKSEFTMHVGDKLTVNAYLLPAAASGAEVSWSCSNENGNYLKIEPDPEDPLRCSVECIAALSGGVKLTAKADGLEASCQIYLIP